MRQPADMRRGMTAPKSGPGPSADIEVTGSGVGSCWHPVMFAADLGESPAAAILLGRPLSIWRDAEGTAHAMTDQCIHRGTAFALGRVEGDELVCAYHGWHFDRSGRCTLIPQLADPTRVPPKARVDVFECVERYGLIWAAIDPPRWPLPQVPELESDGWRAVACGPYFWEADASRQLENFTDFGHFPWVHPGLLGDPSRPVVPDYRVETDGHILRYDIVRPEAPNSDDYPIFANPDQSQPLRASRYEVHLPYTLVLRLGWGGREQMVYFFASQPVDSGRCSGFLFVARNYDLDKEDQTIRAFEDVIFEQDRPIVESQRPDRVPFGLEAEIHLKFDAVAVAYRRAMGRLGLG